MRGRQFIRSCGISIKSRISGGSQPSRMAWSKSRPVLVWRGTGFRKKACRCINEALRDHIKHQNETLEEIVRRVIREEIHAAG